MPKIRRQNLPPALLNHLLDRIIERGFLPINWVSSLTGLLLSQKFRRADGSNDFLK
jgi:hypothetical protein